MMVKEAGMSFEPVISEMDLSYHSRYKVQQIIECYDDAYRTVYHDIYYPICLYTVLYNHWINFPYLPGR